MSQSVRSHNSSRSSKNGGLTGAKKTDVDETLFGTRKTTKVQVDDERKRAEIEKIKEQVLQGTVANPDVIIIPQSDLQRMRNEALIMTKEEQMQQKLILDEQKEKQQAAAKAKKDRMMQLEAEKKKYVPLTEGEQEDLMKANTLKNRAEEMMNENLDEVKHMNQMIVYAKCVTIRDKQLEEKKGIHEARKLEEKRKDLMMEIDRLKLIKKLEEEERAKREEQRKGHLKIIDQIKENEMKRLKIQEEKEQEGQRIIRGIEQLKKEEAAAAIKKKEHARMMLDEIYAANQAAIKGKESKIIQEREEIEKIIKYNQEKEQKEAEYLAEQKRIKDEKEREVQRLRELQEKAYDRQADLDLLRAKRAMELADRQAREKERKEAETRAKRNLELFEARKLQALDKERRFQEQAKQDRDEFQRIIQEQKKERDIELKLDQDRHELVKKHAEELKKQMALAEEKRKQEKRNLLEEGKKIKDNLKNQKRTLDAMKVKKLEELQREGIPQKYTVDLQKKKIVV